MAAHEKVSAEQFAEQFADRANRPEMIGSSQPYPDTGEPTPHYYRWMHKDEYATAERLGHFRPTINVSPAYGPSDSYKYDNAVHVRFPHMQGVFKSKGSSYRGPGRAAWAEASIPFHLGEKIDET
jgi:hypothetical protein